MPLRDLYQEALNRHKTTADIKDDPSMVLGMTLVEAANYLQKYGYRIRARFIDGKPQITLDNADTNRLNVAVSNGKIVTVYSWI
jgi:hypothetical protein